MHGNFWHTPTICNCRSFGCVFIEPDLFDNNVPFDITSYHSDLSHQSALEITVRIRLDLELHYFGIFSRKIMKTSTLSSANFTEGNILLKERTRTINDKIQLHIVEVPVNKLGNWLTAGRKRHHALWPSDRPSVVR